MAPAPASKTRTFRGICSASICKGGGLMRAQHYLFVASLIVLSHAGVASAQSSAALSGQVTSVEEPVMEGVLVNARKAGSNMTLTVVSDAKGRYAFPAGRL